MEYKPTVKTMKIIRGLIATVAVIISVAAPVVAAPAGGSVQGYAADTPIQNGMIVQLTGKNSNRVKLVPQSELQNMFGVTVDRNQLSFVLSNSGLENEVFVAVSGTYNVLVSTQGGAVESGDYVTLSALDGVAMKAGTKEKTVLGRANGSFDGKGTVLSKATLKDDKGQSEEVNIGTVPVTIDIKRNPNQKSTKTRLPKQLERLGEAVADKEVSPVRIYLSMAITAVSIIAAIVLLYSGVRNGVVSIGRNPMSKKSIFRALLEIVLTSVLILIIGLFAVYLLLKL